MRLRFLLLVLIPLTVFAQELPPDRTPDIRLAFGSCNRQDLPQDYWNVIAGTEPDYWIWSGDNIYGDSPDTAVLAKKYQKQLKSPEYTSFLSHTPVTGTWDDHDYGVNDGGKEWEIKADAKQLFTQFMGMPASHEIHNHEGVYHSVDIIHPMGKVRILNLDTRTFRDSLTPSDEPDRRYEVNSSGDILGKAQWEWLTEELSDTSVDLFVINSSIQVIAEDHGWEKWANLPMARNRLFGLIASASPQAVLVISGDRHIAEFSALSIDGLPFPLTEVTSSGLTHTWSKAREEVNVHREGQLIIAKNFGVLDIDINADSVSVKAYILSAEDGHILGRKELVFPHN